MTQTGNVRSLTIQVLDDKGGVREEFYFAQEKIVIGRILSADLKIEDASVSRVHALIEVQPHKISVTDLASTHGTFINGSKVVSGDFSAGQVLTIGKVKVAIKDGGLDKVPEEFRQNYLETSATPPLGTKTGGQPVVAHPTAGAPEPQRHTPTSTPKHIPSAKTPTKGKGTPAEIPVGPPKALPKLKEKESFTQQIVKEHARVLGGGECLSVAVYWNEAVLDDSLFRPGSKIRIGEAPRNDYMIPMGHIQPSDHFDFVELDEGGATIRVHPDMTGTIRMRDQNYTVSAVDKIPGVQREGSFYRVRIGRKDFAKISIGSLTFFMIYVSEPPAIPPLPFWEPDPWFRRLAMVVLVLTFFFGGILAVFVKPEKIETLEQVPERVRAIIVDPTKPRMFARKARVTQMGGNEGEGAKAQGDEGKRGMKDAKLKEGITNIPKMKTQGGGGGAPKLSAQAKAQRKAVTDKDAAMGAGILGALKGGGLGNKLGKLGGGNDPLGSLMLGLSGPGAGEGSGRGSGLGLKGTGGGGGGTAVGIGGLGTKGSGFGRQGLGSGSMPGKGEASISTVAENIQVLGGLTKEIIEAVIRRHLSEVRYCYEAELQRFPKLRGRVEVTFVISPAGGVTTSSVRSSSLGNSSVENCIRTAVRRWIFPAAEMGGSTTVNYPFMLSRG